MSRIPRWSLHKDGHAITGAILVERGSGVEAQVLLDDDLLCSFRHVTRIVAEQELGALLAHYKGEGWTEPEDPPDFERSPHTSGDETISLVQQISRRF